MAPAFPHLRVPIVHLTSTFVPSGTVQPRTVPTTGRSLSTRRSPMSALALVAAQDAFTRTLAAVEDAARFAFRRRMKPQEYEEALAEAKAAAWSAWHGLLKRGKDPLEVGVHGIATNAIRNVRQGRRVGNATCGRGAMDVYHRRAQAACGFTLVGLDSEMRADADRARGSWREWLAEDHRVGPADEACFRVDFAAWLEGLPPRKRRVAELLAEGHEAVVVAGMGGGRPGGGSHGRGRVGGEGGGVQSGEKDAAGGSGGG